MELTQEQKDILKAFKKHNHIKINAYAGTGKTTTLIEIAKDNPNLNFLVLVFNKSVKLELETKMPSNCTVMTIHSLAYKFLDTKFKRKGVLTKKDFTTELSKYFHSTDYFKTTFLRDVLEKFCNSYYLEAKPENIRQLINLDKDLRNKYKLLYNANYDSRNIADLASKINTSLLAVSNFEIGLTHDIYLKFFQKLLPAKFIQDYLKSFDALLVDESQDLNGIQEYLLVNAPIKKKVAVGDKHQSIYSWRGAENTLAKLDWQEFYLTMSFRFKHEGVVELANQFLNNWKGETRNLSSQYTGRENNLTAHITRTNAQIIELIDKAKANEKIRFTREISEIFRSVKEIVKLIEAINYNDPSGLSGYLKLIYDKMIKENIKETEQMSEFFLQAGDYEYFNALEIVKKYGEYKIDDLYKKAIKLKDPNGEKVFTTAHSAKGMEFDNVVIEKDFANIKDIMAGYIAYEILDKKSKISEEQAESLLQGIKNHDSVLSDVIDEINLQYVATTRAIKNISGAGLKNIVDGFREVFKAKELAKIVNKRREDIDKSLGINTEPEQKKPQIKKQNKVANF
ncbi:putative DNA helicase [Desulfurella amilsii]|jgi:superfamily I DNA/RNA helicase|uniref:Putative DNA helicase n=1 Tax=Desulfurella amilsii TaxID=1562698 RepID=A0A1X4XYC3_9BACT|nr:UvrD-helicase domain-containing protein [Desulfurella amilsii]OSS42541.1 putative DNA helicase [Desulfurella amilsii]